MQQSQRLSSPPVMKTSSMSVSRQSNGYFSPPDSPSTMRNGGSVRGGSTRIRSMTSSFMRSSNNNSQTSVVRDTAIALKRKSASELGAGISDTADKVTFIDLVEWIRSERLSVLPHKGSKYDHVLIRALYFAERLHGFETALKGHAFDVEPASHIGYGHTRLLLELGHENSAALDKAFAFLYRCSASVASLLARSQALAFSSDLFEQLAMMYSDLLTLVVDVAVRFYKTVHSGTGASASLDMHEIFGDTIATFRQRRDQIVKSIWQNQIAYEDIDGDDAVEVDKLSRWLAPQDLVLSTLVLDHTLIADQIAEFSCVWFQENLSKFIKSEDDTLLVNGPAGSGKTTLAASIVERLQRPIARKSFATAFVSVGAVSSQASSLNVVKALLHQLLNMRVGNMHLYRAVARAFEHAEYEADANKYEDLLWNALEDALRNPLDKSQDTILVVEGVDEVLGGQAAGQGLLQRLVHAVHQGQSVKLIALSQSLALPTGTAGTRDTIDLEGTREDIHEVVIKVLVHSSHFRSRTGRDQEQIINRIVETSGGSFLWATLTSELLRLEKTPDSFTRAVGNLQQKTSIEDLVQRILTALEPSEEAKLLLSWLVHVARPLTYDEVEMLFSMNALSGARSDRRVDVQHALHSLSPILTIQENIIRVRHQLVHLAVQTLLKNGKITTSVKDQPMDLLLRLLTYAKVALPDKGEPTLDNTDRSVIEHNFHRHPFLEYVVRYWTWHLQQTSVISRSKPSEFKVTPEIQKVFPESTVMPILEWLCWDEQYPGAQEVEYHDLVGRLRSKILTEQHPAVLQSYINTAAYYGMMKDVPHAERLYYLISTIGRNVLSVSHPIVVECSIRFLHLTHSHITTTRTEIMTHREQILILLISAYERQYGVSADIVVQTREQLAEFYMHINEHDKATEVLKVIQGHTHGTHDHGSARTRAIDEQLRVTLGKGKATKDLETYDGIFTEDIEDEAAMEILDLAQVDVILRQIASEVSQKNTAQAEQTYIELWQRLSESCRTTRSTEWHAKKIEVVQSYAQFLETQQRRIEATSLHTSLFREYQHHELSFSESIVSMLTKSAYSLKSVGEYTAALAIFKHASTFYRNTKNEQSRSFSEIEEEMITTSQRALEQSSKEMSESSSKTSQIDMFHVLISNKSKSIDSTTMSLSKQLTAQYIKEKNYAMAVTVVHSTLERTWSSFLAKSIHEVTMTATYQKESIELVEQLAECYIHQRLFERAEDVYVRLFRAALTTPKDQVLLEKVKGILIAFYTKRGHPDKVISVYQEILAVYRRTLGPSHDTTISVLYELASRCRDHARSHPYWIEYYQQIVTVLNKDSQTCHVRALDALIIVSESYWEERRYSDAVAAYGLIWNTFVHKHKDFKRFSEVTFVRSLYERYYQCLEETKADFEVLRSVSEQYRETTKAVFGASSAISIEATVALAKVLQYSESHAERSISLYEEAQQHVSQSKDTSITSLIDSKELNESLTTMYRRRVFHSDSKSVSQETVQKATSAYHAQLQETKSQYGYSHESTLSSVRELSQLYMRQQKTDLAVKELTTAVVSIVQNETSSQKMYQSAESLVQTFQACSLTQQCTQLVQELHYQLITREKSTNASFSVVESSSASLFFLAVMQYQLRKDISLTLSEIMASLKAESIMYWHFKQLMTQKAPLDKALIAAAPLRHLLKYWHRDVLVSYVENQAVSAFVEREAANVQLLSKESPRWFILGIMDHLANRKTADFVRAVIVSSNHTLSNLIAQSKFNEAHDVAKMAYMYAQYRKGYRGPKGVARGFALASQLDGRGENKCPDPELRKKLLGLSNTIIKDILKICREEKINFAQIQLSELNELIALLGEQQDYDTLEMLLNELWTTREAQRQWPSDVLLNLGRRLICARFLAGHQIKAIRLCEDIAYNLRRVNGIRHPATLETYDLLAQLYTTTGQHYQKEAASDKAAGNLAAEHFKKAIIIHEDVLRWLLSDASGGAVGEDDDDDDTAASILKEHGVDHSGDTRQGSLDASKRATLVKHHMHLLKLAYQRLGQWPKPYAQYERLNADLFKTFGDALKDFEGTERWDAKKFGQGRAETNEGVFAGTRHWEIVTAH